MIENNKDALEDLLAVHAKAAGRDISSVQNNISDSVVSQYTPEEKTSNTNPVEEESSTPYTGSFADMNVDTIAQDVYGEHDLENEIAEEERAYEQERARIANEAITKREERESSRPFMPPNEDDMRYHNDAIGFQSEKLSVVSNMVQKVVAKYRIISGEIPETANAEIGTIGRRAVMGELIDIYHKNGEKITPDFEKLILCNWVMPDGTLAIHNINSNGIVIDKTMFDQPTNTNVESTDKETDTVGESNEKTVETPTINITVEKNTPVTVNVDESIVSQLSKTNEVNVHVKEVTEKELMATTIVENSNQDGIISVYDSGINDVPVTLPLSAYRCVMRPINWFDFIKLTAPTSQNAPDNELKKWSVIYEHIKNPSIGDFENFEDFLKKTKYQDRELLMWGLLVATADDVEPLSIKCGNPKCNNQIKIKYNPRKLVHLDESLIPSWYDDAYKASPGAEAYKVWESVNGRRKRYKLPNTGIIAEVNEPSAYEFITIKLPLMNELYKRYRPDGQMTEVDMNDPSMLEFDYLSTNAMFVSALTIVRNEQGKRKEYRYTNWEDIEKIITTGLDAEDSGILLKIIEKTRTNVTPVAFRVDNVDCPVCGRHEEYIPINDIGSTLLFQVSRRLSNTQINLIEMD